MPWFIPWSDSIKKRSCRYLLQRYLGQFLEEKLTLDQLTVDLYNGIGSVSDVSLDVQALNDLGEQYNWPIEFVDGFISEISVSIPWSSLLNESSSVEVQGLNLVIQPKPRSDYGAQSMFESMWSSMTSSMQLAEECLKQTDQNAEQESTNFVNGVEEFAKTIDSILTRVKLKFINTVIRIEHLPKGSSIGVAIEMHIKQFSYYDETSTEDLNESNTKPTTAYSVKMFSFEGVELYSNEFCASNRTICRSLLLESTTSIGGENDIFDRKPSHHDIIPVGKLLGKQEIRMKIKQKENVSGPKLDLEMNMSSLVIFLSPRQLRTICEVVCGLMSPHLQDTSNVVTRSHNQKPMTSLDFERVEQELTQQISPSNLNNFVAKSLQNATGWSSGGVEDESDDDFHPVKGHAYSSLSSSVANSVSSSFSSSVSSYQYNSKMSEACGSTQGRHHHKHKEKGGSSEPDFSGDISSFQLRLNFLTVLLLHQDILRTSDETVLPSQSLVEEMKEISRQFFSKYMSLCTSSGRNDFHGGRQILEKALPDRNHLRLYCTTNILNGEEKSNSVILEIRGSLTMANVELVECLMELNDKPEFVELVSFIRHDTISGNETTGFSQPDVNIHFKHFNNSKHFSTPSRTELTINLQDCRSELDVTIIDRLVHIINNVNILLNSFGKPTESRKTIFNDVVTAPTIENKFDWKVSTAFLLLKLRFPVPDMRTEIEDDQSYWHKRNVYSDTLFVELTETSVQSIAGQQLAQNYEIQCKSVRVLFQDANSDKPIPFILSEVDEKFCMSLPNGGRGFGWPRVVVRLYPKIGYIELEEEMDDRHDFSMNQSIMQTQKQEPSPFTNKMIMRESDTSHSKSNSNNDGEEIILPGSKEEIGEFVEDASHNALIQVEVTLPSVTVQIPSKHFYEVLYNRISSDLMLWMPRSSKKSFNFDFKDRNNQNFNFNFNPSPNMFTSFSMCKSGVKNNSDSEEDDSNENLLFNNENVSQSQKKKATSQQQSKVAISVFAARGILDIFPHARESSGKVIPGQFGEVQLLFNEANLFCVSGYKAEPLLNYVCLQINHISLYHCSLIPGNCEMSLKPVDSYPSKYVLPTIYRTTQGAVISENSTPVGIGSTNSHDMLTLAVRVQGQDNRVKNICVANSLNGVTIRHRMKPAYTSWLSQLIDFFDIIDYPISHYHPWQVVTALHQQFLNCVIDYRPLHMPLKAALTVENFNISSNITAKTSTSILRFIAEEASLFISNKCDKADQPENLSIDLRNDYVCVVDLGLFELSLRLTDDGVGEPQTDLRASNNIVHIRTCADSAVALMELVKYIASDGDLVDNNVAEDMKKPNDDVLVNFKDEQIVENMPRMSRGNSVDDSDEGVHQLVEEAMNDTIVIKPKKRSGHPKKEETGKVEMFFFPDEEDISGDSSVSQNYTDSQSSEDDWEAEYCILDKEINIGYMVSGVQEIPDVKLLTKEQIRLGDNHFNVPVSKVDDLKAPRSYPDPVSKYTLREMTVVWHMYGGHDFIKPEAAPKTSSKKQVTIISDKGSNPDLSSSIESNRRLSRNSSVDSINIAYSVAKPNELPAINFIIPRNSPCFNDSFQNDSPTVLYDRQKSQSWQAQGGVNRQHDALMELRLTKLKYQYEIYPKETKHASRQILLVQEVEIRDRMATSNINKFLYLYSSAAKPKQSHANMVVIKATNIRPEPNVYHLQECCLRVSLLPLRLNIDQDSLLFLINFFSEISGNSKEEEAPPVTTTAAPKPPQMQPVMNIENINTSVSPSMMVQVDDRQTKEIPVPAKSPIFIRSFVFSPEVPIRLDYEGKRVDMSHGPVAGLIMGLGQLNCSELRLKRLCNRHGILGIDKLISYILTEWLQDIKKNQLPSILGGVGPMYSLVQLFQGIRDLFWLPIEQYQKDGRIIRGLQRGANSFSTSTAMAALELTARIVYAIQRIAETAFDIVSPGPSIRQLRIYERNGKNDHRKNRRHHKYSQPADIREGVATALLLVKEGFGETAQTLVRVASIEHEVKGAVGAVGGVLRQMPSTALTPFIIATQATSNVLDGVRSQLVPDARTEAALKWRNDYF